MKSDFTFRSTRGYPLPISLYGTELPGGAPCVVYLHGFMGFKDWGFAPYLGERMAAAGIRFLAFNFSHNGIGDSPDVHSELVMFRENTFSLELEEACEVIAALADGELGISGLPAMGGRIGLMGHSRGGGIALLAGERMSQVQCVCTWAAVSTFARYPDPVIQKWKKDGVLDVTNGRTGQVMQIGWNLHKDLMDHIRGRLDIKGAVTRLSKPLCILHAEDDQAVSADDARAIFGWAEEGRAEMHLLPDGGHTFGSKHPFPGTNPQLEDAIRHTLNFFSHHLNP